MRKLPIVLALIACLATLSFTRPAQARTLAGPVQDYVVKPGDTLLALAMHFNTTIEAIQAANELPDADVLQAGQTLRIPSGDGASTAGEQITYVVQSGDTLSAIGAHYGVQVADLSQVNGISDAKLLQIGQRLVIPILNDAGSAPTAAPAVELVPLTAPDAVAVALPDDADLESIRSQLLELYNQVRVASGAAPLVQSAVLQASAQGHAEDCATRGSGSHFGSDGSKSSQRITRAGYAGRITGENWAWARSAAGAFDMWYTQEIADQGPHLMNILSPRYTDVGFGVARSRGGFYLIANFGAP
jgi:uncharacterized protein YkwD